MRTLRTTIGMLAMSAVLLLVATGSAVADGSRLPDTDSVLYELTENMHIGLDANNNNLPSRLAMAALQGTAKLGTPWCPKAILLYINPNIRTCTITAIGEDGIEVVPGPNFGKGWVKATGATVVQDTNLADGPEAVVLRWTFSGFIDLSLAALELAPLGFLEGDLDVNGTKHQLVGTFRLPFVVEKGKLTKPRRDRDRDDDRDYDRARDRNRRKVYYLGDDGQFIPVQKNERSLGLATVRLEVTFPDQDD